MMKNIVLASQSPRRQELLKQLNIPFEIVVSRVKEVFDPSEDPSKIVKELALQKGMWVQNHCRKSSIIISADTIVVAEGQILGKPKNIDDARNMLSLLSGKKHQVFTGLCIIDSELEKKAVDVGITDVYFRNLDREEIEGYLRTSEPYDKAGAYGIQGLGAVFIDKIDGDFFTVMGLPVEKLYNILKTFNINIWYNNEEIV